VAIVKSAHRGPVLRQPELLLPARPHAWRGQIMYGRRVLRPLWAGQAVPLRGEGKGGTFEEVLLPVLPAQEILS